MDALILPRRRAWRRALELSLKSLRDVNAKWAISSVHVLVMRDRSALGYHEAVR
jgi:hypothetical protein